MAEGLVRVTDPPLFSPSPPLLDLEIGKERMTKSSSAPFLSALPIWNRFGLFIQAYIALMPSWFNLSLFQSRQNGAALLLHMSAVLKPASSQVGRKVWKGILQLLFAGQLHAVHIEGREPRRIRCQGATRQAVQLHMAGVCRPRPSFWLTSPVERAIPESSAFNTLVSLPPNFL